MGKAKTFLDGRQTKINILLRLFQMMPQHLQVFDPPALKEP